MISRDRLSRFFFLEPIVALLFREFEMLPDETFDLADLLQHGLVLGQRDLNELLEDPEKNRIFEKLKKECRNFYPTVHFNYV